MDSELKVDLQYEACLSINDSNLMTDLSPCFKSGFFCFKIKYVELEQGQISTTHMHVYISFPWKKTCPPMPDIDGAFLFHVNFTHLAWGDRFPPHLSYGFEFGGAVGYQIWLDLYHRIEQESFLLKDNVIESESNGNTYSCSIFKEISINRIIHNTFQMHLKMEQSKHHLPLTIKEKM